MLTYCLIAAIVFVWVLAGLSIIGMQIEDHGLGPSTFAEHRIKRLLLILAIIFIWPLCFFKNIKSFWAILIVPKQKPWNPDRKS